MDESRVQQLQADLAGIQAALDGLRADSDRLAASLRATSELIAAEREREREFDTAMTARMNGGR